ncbi:MAG TPA: protein phosphatase 2C domain-containing protein [Ktedonobacteraceae bacterium]
MSTHRSVPGMPGRITLFVLSMLSGLLIALQLLLPAVAFASVNAGGGETARALPPQQQEALDLAGVSVVRLVVTYRVTGTNPENSMVACTGIGTLIASGSPTIDTNSWVLTDSSLVHLSGTTCTGIAGQLASITISPNTTYTNTSSIPIPLGQLQCSPAGCHDGITGSGPTEVIQPAVETAASGVVFSFHTDAQHMQPFLNVAQSSSNDSAQQFGIELANGSASTGKWPPSSVVVQTNEPTQFLVPNLVTLTNSGAGNAPTPLTTGSPTPVPPTPVYEPGMPVIDAHGTVMGMYLSGNKQITFPQINNLMGMELQLEPAAVAQDKTTNVLYKNWMAAVTDFYKHDYKHADTALRAIERTNPQFQAPVVFETQKVLPALQRSGGSATSTSASGNGGNATILGLPAHLVILVGVIVGLVLLICLLVVVSLTFGRARARRWQEMAKFKTEQAEAQRIAEMEAQRQQQSKITARLQPPFSGVRCPNCNAQVTANDSVCPNCHYLLSATDSGMHLRAAPPSTAESLTQPNLVPSVPGPLPASSISEMPTVQFSPSNRTMDDNERTLPYNIQQLQGRNLSLAVGALSDRGIKRQHKPNEDNLFAVQATRPNNAEPQQFGLFVVADGMGGHANGQDASRLAIQTIIDFMLPRLSSSNPMNEEDFKNLLAEGVQCANQAVHQRNMEERADMGTTMTAALIVGAIAYVSNVGDSRTYLYREPEGLVKITHDHSVVASLVDAGIIKPDDIYTHPKRNQIYRSLGEKLYVEVDTFKVPLRVGDKLLLCSDGLWDMVRDPEIQRVMSAPVPDPGKTGKALIQAALDGGGEDNVSVIVVSINEVSNQPTISGVQLIAKPETVTVPDMP